MPPVAVDTAAIGKQYPPVTYAVGREKIREYAFAVGETNPLHLDVEAARAAGYRDVVAPPMFASVYCSRASRRFIRSAGSTLATRLRRSRLRW